MQLETRDILSVRHDECGPNVPSTRQIPSSMDPCQNGQYRDLRHGHAGPELEQPMALGGRQLIHELVQICVALNRHIGEFYPRRLSSLCTLVISTNPPPTSNRPQHSGGVYQAVHCFESKYSHGLTHCRQAEAPKLCLPCHKATRPTPRSI
jgi:hypothetical protein